jgi:hypothetical protein
MMADTYTEAVCEKPHIAWFVYIRAAVYSSCISMFFKLDNIEFFGKTA